MYGKSNTIISKIEELGNYIEGYDLYNSELVEKLQEPGLDKKPYEITVYQYRPDLIAEEFYGSRDYMGLLMLQAGLTLTNFTKGSIIELIPKNIIDRILRSI
jgi:hypothetical protein